MESLTQEKKNSPMRADGEFGEDFLLVNFQLYGMSVATPYQTAKLNSADTFIARLNHQI